jgi:archaeosine synthase beta-subunit
MSILSVVFSFNAKLLNFLFSVLDKIGYRFSSIDKIYDTSSNKAVPRWTLLLPATGCAWAKAKGGSCYMCGFAKGASCLTGGVALSSDKLLKYVKINKDRVADNRPEILAIYNGGSFFNPSEICLSAQCDLFSEIESHPTLKKIFFDSRPAYINETNIKTLLSMLSGKRLIVGLGLECVNDEIRAKSINKGFNKDEYEAAVSIIKKAGGLVTTYVFIKPLFLSEREAIEEAVNTVKYAFACGSDEIALEAAFIQKGTVMEKYYKAKQYSTPWLWSIIEVVRRTHHLGVVRIGDFSDFPAPIALPKNCPSCSAKVKTAFENYKISLDHTLFDSLECDCKKDWRKLIQ